MICDDDTNDRETEACEIEDGGYYVCDLGSCRKVSAGHASEWVSKLVTYPS